MEHKRRSSWEKFSQISNPNPWEKRSVVHEKRAERAAEREASEREAEAQEAEDIRDANAAEIEAELGGFASKEEADDWERQRVEDEKEETWDRG